MMIMLVVTQLGSTVTHLAMTIVQQQQRPPYRLVVSGTHTDTHQTMADGDGRSMSSMTTVPAAAAAAVTAADHQGKHCQ